MNKKTKGLHLIVDAVCHTDLDLNNKTLIEKVLNRIVEIAGMQFLQPTQLIEVKLDPEKVESGDDDGGLTGIGVLTTSHISIHTWPLTNRFSFDMYSCRTFDPDFVIKYLANNLKIVDANVIVVERQSPQQNTGITWNRN